MENLSTQDSFKIIQNIIDQRKQKYEENGFFLLFWGVLFIIAGTSHFVMLQMEQYNLIKYVWMFTMIPGSIITFVAGFRDNHKKAKNNESTDWTGWIWGMAGCLALLTGFVFGNKFGHSFITILLLPFCFASMASALSLKNNLWIILTILGTILTYVAIFIPGIYHSLIAAGVGLLIFLIPGIQLYSAHKKRCHV